MVPADDSPVYDLLAAWDEARRAGREVAPEELCADRPDLLADLRKAIDGLRATAWMDEPLAGPAVTPDPPPVPAVLGEYEVHEPVGAGGMGVVYRATHRRMARTVAVKVLPPRFAADPAWRERFRAEVRAAARLVHPHVVTAFDAGEQDCLPYLVTEYVEGVNLGELVRRDGPLPVGTAVGYVRQAALGLAFAHRAGVVHRDVKPGNLLLAADGIVKVADLGLAALRGPAGDAGPDAAVGGSVDFMSPEQADPVRPADPRTDQYGLGATLYFLLTGRPVFSGDTVLARLTAHRDAPAPSLREARPDVPAGLDRVFQTLVAKRPKDRFPSMDDVVATLNPFLPGRTQSRIRRAPWVAGTILLVGVAGLLAWRFGGQAPPVAHPNPVAVTPPSPAGTPGPASPPPVTSSADSRLFHNTTDDIRAVAVSRDGKLVLTGSFNTNMVRLWDVASGDLIRSFPGHTRKVHGVALSPDGTLAASGGGDDDGTVRLWNVQTGDLVRVIAGHEGGVWSVVFDPEGRHVFSAGADKLVRMWAVGTGDEVRQFKGHAGQVFKVAVSSDGKHLLTGGADNRAFWWDVPTGEPVYEFRGHATAVWAVAISPDGTRGLSGDQAGIIRLLDLTTGKEVGKWLAPTEAVFALAFHPSGKFALSGGGGGWRRRHDETPEKPADVLVYARAENNAITLWDVPTGRIRHHFNGHADAVWGLAFGPAGDWFVSGGRDKTSRLWRLPE